MRYFYSKSDRIKSSDDIRKLFQNGKAFFSYPLKLVILWEGQGVNFKSAAIVPKKQLPKAHQRNRIKRKMKETIRLNLPMIRQKFASQPFDFLLVYMSRDESISYEKIQKSFLDLLQEAEKHFNE